MSAGDPDLLDRVRRVLEDPVHRENPLLPLLAELHHYAGVQDQRMERLLRIADGYQFLQHEQSLTLAERCEKQLRRTEKLARISDRYQRELLELTESLREAANKDPLTGLANRRYLMERIRDEIQRARRQGSALGICIMDVDHFKQINDRFGHETGDQALCRIAAVVQDSVRSYDVYGRWGGEEFLLILPQTATEEALGVIQRVRSCINGIHVPQGKAAGMLLSASFGLTTLRAGEEDPDILLKRADQALFRAKDAGRNRVEQG
ncbi:hypothetical protein CKO33_12615 [Ectothiorhodospira mobilis]|nr:hypothetical protein [Ectothiorhodospira mobilis]